MKKLCQKLMTNFKRYEAKKISFNEYKKLQASILDQSPQCYSRIANTFVGLYLTESVVSWQRWLRIVRSLRGIIANVEFVQPAREEKGINYRFIDGSVLWIDNYRKGNAWSKIKFPS